MAYVQRNRFEDILQMVRPDLSNELEIVRPNVPQQNNLRDCGVPMLIWLGKWELHVPLQYTKDSTFEFERKRNRPERYDRNLVEDVLKAIPKIDKIRVSREERHHKNRMKGYKAKLLKEAARELEQGINLVKAPSVLQQDPSLTLPKIKVRVSQQQAEENRPMEE
ncbi:probable ribosome biogenesis protein RLP24 [Neltuma alba]|uniref:probable ribosome biogenesis protein RLP24 n=1 Tax=Neltuma alba TaxID=207710 RepID=UPI0010A3767C|nr:probable ribosome biogenesis protein RLP24 [Prosopis alba]